jgi:hypothetical protein
MNTKLHPIFATLALLACVHQVAAQGTAFTYQGRLNSGGSPASGLYDFRFKLYVDPFGNTQVGTSYLTNAVPTTNGLFITTIDFGAGIFTGTTNWLEVDVRTNGISGYTMLNPYQELMPTPYAIFAETASNLSGVLPAAQLSGTILNSSLPASPNFGGTVTAGSFSGDGAGVTNVNAAALNGLNATNFWQLGGNNVAPGQFLGSTNNQPLELWVNGQRALRLEPNTNSPNVIGGWSNNFAGSGVVIGTIGGGGGLSVANGLLYTNSVWSDYGTVGGGLGNQAGTIGDDPSQVRGATAVGGGANIAGAHYSTIVGGDYNNISQSGDFSFIGGGYENLVLSNSTYSTIGGGEQNQILSNSSWSSIDGGFENQVTNSYATVLGGYLSVAGGAYSLAAGVGARAFHQGSTVFADSQFNYFDSTTTNEFSIRAQNGVRIQSDVGIHLDAADEPLIVRDWDVFATNAPADKAGIGRWGLFMEPDVLTIGIPSNDVPGRYFQVAKYSTNGTPTTLMQVDQSGNVTASSFNAGGGVISGNGSGLTVLNASQLTSGTVPNSVLPPDVALLDAPAQTFTGVNTFSGPGASLIIDGGPISTSLFTGLALQYYPSGEGAIMSSYNDGHGYLTFYTKQGAGYPIVKQMQIDQWGGVAIDQQNYNNGVINNSTTNGVGLTFGNSSGEGITSKRTAGGNVDGLDFYTSFAARLSIANNGSIGIGTTTPAKAKVEIEGVAGSYAFGQRGYLNSSGAGSSSTTGTDTSASLWASGNIWAGAVLAFSDERIKRIEGRSNSAHDLATLLGIEVTDYTYIDTVAKGAGKQKKVIAQQVEKVYPQAVSRNTDVVPDIYQKAVVKDGWVKLATNLKKGERVRLIGGKTEGIFEVLEVAPGRFRTGYAAEGNDVFVYGREVKDFRSVDYEAIAMLNVSATQELNRRLEQQAAELAARDGRISALEKTNQEMQRELAAQKELENHLQAQFATVQEVIARLSDESARTIAFNH